MRGTSPKGALTWAAGIDPGENCATPMGVSSIATNRSAPTPVTERREKDKENLFVGGWAPASNAGLPATPFDYNLVTFVESRSISSHLTPTTPEWGENVVIQSGVRAANEVEGPAVCPRHHKHHR
jgi:hypothetical protein